MTVGQSVEAGSGVSVAAGAAETAADLAQAVRDATRELPFGVEPASFMVALESMAEAVEAGE
jgi:hypothetical protein